MTEKTTRTKRIWDLISKIRSFLSNLVFLLILGSITVVIVFSLFDDDLKDPEGKALVINPQGPIVEQIQGSGDPLSFILQGQPQKEVLVGNLLDILEAAEDDERIKFIVLKLDNIYGTGQTVLFDIGQVLKKLKEKGKIIISIGDAYDESAYYLASFSNEIILNPDGFIFLDGYSRYRTYFKSFLEKLKVSVNLFRVGKYKSAMEPYIRDDMSKEAKEASKAYMEVLWDSWKGVVAENRDMQTSDLQYFVDNAEKLIAQEKGDAASALLKANLIDKISNRTQTRKYLKETIGKSENEENFNQISGSEYFQFIKAENKKKEYKDKIAVIVAQGTILDGKHPPGTIGGDSTAKLIRNSHENEDVKGIVLRVDSGGGSAFASEVIREEILSAKLKGIPVIASMSNVAASGGYWISASADEIWASHNTITGSIGIFGFFPTFEKSLAEIGIYTDGVSTTKLGGGMDPTRAINPVIAEILQSTIEFGYQRFISLVAKERNMEIEDVEKIAQGRVWAGTTALKLGLVDNLGNLQQAIKRAAELAELDNYKTFFPAEELDWKQQILKNLFSIVTPLIPPSLKSGYVLKESLNLVSEIEKFNDPRGVYAMCLDCYPL